MGQAFKDFDYLVDALIDISVPVIVSENQPTIGIIFGTSRHTIANIGRRAQTDDGVICYSLRPRQVYG